MPIFKLNKRLLFPLPEQAEENGLLAVGGDLSQERLLLAYKNGIFPWYGEKDPILWWSPDPRFVLYPEKLKVSESMRRIIKSKRFRVTFDSEFSAVIAKCRQAPRRGQHGTWITSGMMAAYRNLHALGVAHSVEVWQDNKLVGGLYGLSIGRVFFGESMFTDSSNASKTGFILLVQKLCNAGCVLIDCQVHTDHLKSLGAEFMARKEYLKVVKAYSSQESAIQWS